MLTGKQLKEYRELRGLSTRDVAAYCEVSQPLIVQVENGEKAVTPYNHAEITKGINAAYEVKKLNSNVELKNDDTKKKRKKKEMIEEAPPVKRKQNRKKKNE